MSHPRWAAASLVLAAILAASTARAQDFGPRRVHVTPYAGAFVFDDDELESVSGVEVDVGPIFGARLGFALARSWEIEAGYGIAPLSTELSDFADGDTDGELGDVTAHVLYGAVNYLLGYADNPTRLLLGAGAGALLLDPEPGERSESFLLELAVGFTHPVRDWITVRGEVRDHMAFCSAPDFACPLDDDVLHHLEVSAGLQFWLF